MPLDYVTITGAVEADPNQAAAPGVATVGGRRLRSVSYASTLRHALVSHSLALRLPSPPTFAEAHLLLEQQQIPFRQVLGMLAGSHPAPDLGGSGCKPPGLYEVSETHLSDHRREALAPHAVMAMPCTS